MSPHQTEQQQAPQGGNDQDTGTRHARHHTTKMADTGRVRCGECGVWQDRIRAADPRAEPGIECGLCMTTLAVTAGSPECDGCGLRIDGPCPNCGDGSGDGSDDGRASEIAAAAIADRRGGRDGAVDEATIDRFRPLEGDYFTMFGTHPKEPILEAIGLAEVSFLFFPFFLFVDWI